MVVVPLSPQSRLIYKHLQTTYTNLYTEIWDSMIFRDMVNKCTMNTKPAKMAVCDFVILREILGLSSSLSAISLENQAFTHNVHEFVHENARF